jgi:hypothetical protein
MIIKVQIQLKHFKKLNTRTKEFFFNITEKGVIFTEDTLEQEPLFIFKKLDLNILTLLDFLEEGEEIKEILICIDNKQYFKKFISKWDDEISDLNDYNKFIQNLIDYKEPENLELKKQFELTLCMRREVKETKKVKKTDTKYVDYKLGKVIFLPDEPDNKYLVILKHEDIEVKYLFEDILCCCSKKAISDFIELIMNFEDDYYNYFYFEDFKNNTKLFWRNSRSDTDTINDIITAYMKAKEFDLKQS